MLAAVPNTEWTSTSVARVYSDPFGGIRGNTDADVPGDHRFLGATRDADSGLTLLGARYYDPVTGCFISVDPILNLEVPAHLHAYAYGFNNPVTFSDASGLEPRDQNGNFDGDPYSSPSTTSWAYLNGCGGNLSCVGTWVGNFQLNFYGGLAEGVGGLLLFACSSLCMVPMSVNSAVTAFSDWDAHLASEQAKGEQVHEWWSDPWNNFWRPIGEDWANNPGHAWGGTVFTAATIAVPGGGLIKVGSAARAATAVEAAGGARVAALADEVVAPAAVHGNSARSTATAYLYRLYDVDGTYLKTGISKNPMTRYTRTFMQGKTMDVLQSGTRREMLNLERFIVERDPGPDNLERWAGQFSEDVP